MNAKFPKPKDDLPIVYLKDTDQSLSSDAKTVNNTRYIYFKTIARGGKCLIQSCKDLHLGRVVCYKSLHPEFAGDPTEQQRFLREARVTAMLQHPNIVPIYELGRDTRGQYYFTMKRVSGATFREILDGLTNNDPKITANWDYEQLVDVLIQVGQALDFSHSHGVVHRDVKPANIVVGSFGEVLLLDWGLAKVWDMKPQPRQSVEEQEDLSLTAKGSLEATPLYMSPEQVRGDMDLDHRTDIYSFGAVLFEILTLQHLAWGDTIEEMMSNTESTIAPRPSIVCPDRNIPSHLETICMRCIAKNPDHRYQTMRELVLDLVYWHRLQMASRPM